MTDSIILQDRLLIEIEGLDRKKFLQGLITNDVNKATQKNLIYCAMLSASGRFLYDFFIFEIAEKLILDCLALRRDEILQKLNFYKLRSQVTLKKNDDLQVCSNFSQGQFCDPRHPNLGFRSYIKSDSKQSMEAYNFKRITLKIPESEQDLTYDKSFILEFGFDDLNAIDYQKGCYVGQELTARTHYRGEIRKKLFHVKLDSKNPPEKNSEITCEGKSAGIFLSSVFHESQLHALALIKITDDQDFSEKKEKLPSSLEFKGQKIFIIS
jgi:folate-binding protein YgfZ